MQMMTAALQLPGYPDDNYSRPAAEDHVLPKWWQQIFWMTNSSTATCRWLYQQTSCWNIHISIHGAIHALSSLAGRWVSSTGPNKKSATTGQGHQTRHNQTIKVRQQYPRFLANLAAKTTSIGYAAALPVGQELELLASCNGCSGAFVTQQCHS